MKANASAFWAIATALAAVLGTSSDLAAQATATRQAANTPAVHDAPEGSDANSAKAMAVEKLALQIMTTPAYKEAVAKALKDFQANPYADKPDFMRYVRSAADEAGTFAALYAAMDGVPDPVFIWIAAAPRKWHGYTFPGSRWFADNVDTFYRSARIDEHCTYEITLRTGKTLPAQLSFLTYNWSMLETRGGAQDDVPLSAIEIRDTTPRNADGTITLIAGPGPANGRPNYLELKPGVKQIHVREIRGDGSVPPVGFAIKRTSGPTPRSKSLDELAKAAAFYLDAGVEATNNVTKVFGALAENQLGAVRVRWAEGAGPTEKKMVADEPLGPDRAVGFISSGLFNLKEDEALILTLKTMGTQYVGINTYRPFLVSPEHVYGSSSLNNYQAKANPDGSITFVLSRKDPGVYNWLDVGGIPFGYLAVRWQTLTHPVVATAKNGIDLVKTVKLSELRKELPPTTKWVTREERAEQRATRARQFMLRCLGTPAEVGGELDKPY
jgi:hypothetical protein